METHRKSSPPACAQEIEKAADLLFSTLSNSGLGLFVTADAEGSPHATWMATSAATGPCEVITLTSPDSRKVRNIKGNPRCEWVFSGEDKNEILYLNGVATLVTEPGNIKRYWAMMPEKDRAYFLDFYNSGVGFAIVSTRVTSATLVIPRENRKASIPPDGLWTVHESNA